MIEIGFIRAYGIDYRGTIPKIRKSENPLQPVFEALTNAFESMILKGEPKEKQEILIQCHFTKNLFSKENEELEFKEFRIQDNGIGFTEHEFQRAISLYDNGKGFSNKGSGRVQFIHFFDKTTINSIFEDSESSTGFYERVLEFSKKKPFIDKNAIIRHVSFKEVYSVVAKTTVIFTDPLVLKDQKYYNSLKIDFLKSELINHFLVFLCDNRNHLPNIKIEFWNDGNLKEEITIEDQDVPEVNYETFISIPYREISPDDHSVDIIPQQFEKLNLKSFVIDSKDLAKNELLLTSKGQRAKVIRLRSLNPSDQINKKRYLFLLSGSYIDSSDTDTRGNLEIPTIEEFKKNKDDLFLSKSLVIEDIEERSNEVIELYYSEIKKKTADKLENIEKLKRMFLLNEETIKSLNIGLNDTDDQILKRVYEADAKIIAKKDAAIKSQLEDLDKLDTNSPNYKEELEESIVELVKSIPLQNRNSLTHYVARRKLVLDLFDKILDKQIESLRSGGRIDENLMHNLIFQQSSDNPSDSDLWIINEEFIYFSGFSEYQLKKVEIGGIKLFKPEFEAEEEKFLNSLGKRRLDRRPDILLFPEDGKCIIIELKAPEIDVSDHLTQINKYASLIRNYAAEDFEITRFYGYLIGEHIEEKDVLGAVSNFEVSPNFKYLFQPSQKVIDFSGRKNGSIYTEVIKYSTLLERARLRNKVFIDKLTE